MSHLRAREDASAETPEPEESRASGFRGAAPAPITVPAWKRRLFIDRPADLRAFVADLENASILAIDAEFVQNYQRRAPEDPAHRLTLLQFALDNDYRASYVVDTLRLSDLSPLAEPLERASLLKLFHGMSSDVRVLASRGLSARHTLDLEAVSRSLFGQRESGLSAMLQRAANIHMDKSLQRSDWSRRPLTPAMVAYAARDAEMTYALYQWLSANYPNAIASYETLPDEPPPEVAAWIRPYLDTGRGRPVDLALEEIGLLDDHATQVADLRQALGAALRPNQRARVMRLITDLELPELIPDLRPYLPSSASEERAGATRALGRLHDTASAPEIRLLQEDPIQDVRQAAQTALALLQGPASTRPSLRPERRNGRRIWSAANNDAADQDEPWRAALRARFALPEQSDKDQSEAGE
jgi:hypothetical protein